MKRLPVPPLEQTLSRYLQTVAPLLTAEQRRQTQQVVEEFLSSDGPACQTELERFADVEHEERRNWFSQSWIDKYLSASTPVSLTTNYSGQVDWPRQPDHVVQAADLIHRLTVVHLRHLRGETEPVMSPRGEELSMEQWQFLQGGIRHPEASGVTMVPGAPDPSSREVVVLRDGHAFALQVSDDAGAPFGVTPLAAALQDILSRPRTGPGDFTHPAYLGSQQAAHHLDLLGAHPAGRACYNRLVNALFVVNLVEQRDTAAGHLARTAFALGQAWPLKAASYQVGLADGWVGVQVEHTLLDAGSLDAVLARAVAVQPVDETSGVPQIEPLTWQMAPAQQAELVGDVQAYATAAEQLSVRLVNLPVDLPNEFTGPAGERSRLSADGAMQWIMAAAQLAAFGQIRNTYEAVAMLEYQAGRTEALRPNTAEAIALAEALCRDAVTPELVAAAQHAHARAVVRCKTGQGIDRHLLGLRLAAERLGLAPSIFADDGYATLTSDFLSTTSLGAAAHHSPLTFAPTSPGGLGINYTARPGSLQFCISSAQMPPAEVDRFITALEQAAHRLVQSLGLPAGAAQGDSHQGH